jgi:protein-tyrosine phosphatase
MTAGMCRVASQDGVTHIVATPHCNHEFAYDRNRYMEMMGDLFEIAGGKMTFSLGCDFHFSYENVTDVLANPSRYTIDGTQYLLVEFSDFGIAPTVMKHLMEISSNGLTPIITHPERLVPLLKHSEMVLDFVDQGCLVQVTANALTGFWGAQAKKMVEWLLQRRAVHVVASDAHDPQRRSPVMSLARMSVAKLAGAEVADALVHGNPAAIVAGESIPYQPSLR